jgi:site-specific recombinase XerD
MTTTALTTRQDQTPTTTNVMTAFGAFLRLHVADGDASPATFRSYHSNAGQFVAWCVEHGINPATATEDDIATYRSVADLGEAALFASLDRAHKGGRCRCGPFAI